MILVTGATGFIGRHVLHELEARGRRVRAVVRQPGAISALPRSVEGVVVGDLAKNVEWSHPLNGVHAVIHLAALAHFLRKRDRVVEPLVVASNVVATRDLAEAAALAGVGRFLFVSSAGVLGEETLPGQAWHEDSPCAPRDVYARSKLAAEHALHDVASRTGLNVVILRPPGVYGPGVRANFLEMLRLVDRGVPLPLGLVHNRRSLVYVQNLVDVITLAIDAPNAAGELFHVTDGEDVSTGDLVRRIAQELGRPARLIPIPPSLLRLVGHMGDYVERLSGFELPVNTANVVRLVASMTLDVSKLRSLLGWRPRFTLQEGLAKTAEWYKAARAQQQPQLGHTGLA